MVEEVFDEELDEPLDELLLVPGAQVFFFGTCEKMSKRKRKR